VLIYGFLYLQLIGSACAPRNDIAITSLEEIHGFDLSGEKWLFTLDELQNATIANTEEKQDIVGKQGRKLTSLKRNKASTVSGSNGLISGGLLSMQSGSGFAMGATEVQWSEVLVVKSNAATTGFVAIGTEGNEVKEVHVRDAASGAVIKTLTQNATVAEGKFAYAPDTKALTFNEGEIEDGAEIVVHYMRKVEASSMKNMSDTYSSKCRLVIDALGEDKCSNVFRIQIIIPKADFSGEFSFEMGDSQTMHNFEAECLAGACGAGGELWSYTVFGVGAEDAE